MTYQAPIAYSQRATPARSLRAIEYDLFAQITQRLRTAWTTRKRDFPGLVRAVADNQRLWSTLAADVATPGNGLPDLLRARLFYLHEFTTRHSRLVLDDKAGVDALVEINTAIMRGLRGDGGAI